MYWFLLFNCFIMLSSFGTSRWSTDEYNFGPVWIDKGTRLCGKSQAFGGDTKEKALSWCSFNQTSLTNQDNRCISLLSGRDEQFTYTSCDRLHSALCESTEKLCHTQKTTHPLSSSINSTKGTSPSFSTMNTTIGRHYFSK